MLFLLGAFDAVSGHSPGAQLPSDLPEVPSSCNVDNTIWWGDGYCDHGELNTPECAWDGGDCCEATCKSDFGFCGQGEYFCLDPSVVTGNFAPSPGIPTPDLIPAPIPAPSDNGVPSPSVPAPVPVPWSPPGGRGPQIPSGSPPNGFVPAPGHPPSPSGHHVPAPAPSGYGVPSPFVPVPAPAPSHGSPSYEPAPIPMPAFVPTPALSGQLPPMHHDNAGHQACVCGTNLDDLQAKVNSLRTQHTQLSR